LRNQASQTGGSRQPWQQLEASSWLKWRESEHAGQGADSVARGLDQALTSS